MGRCGKWHEIGLTFNTVAHQALNYQTPAQVYVVNDQAMLYSTLR
jgi:hypothetical protein